MMISENMKIIIDQLKVKNILIEAATEEHEG